MDGTGGAVTVNGGTLKGNGTTGTVAVNSGGTVAPGNSIGTLNVAGNVGFAAGSTYQVEVDAAGNSDKIAASGSAALNGGTVQIVAAAGTYGTSSSYTILTATGGVTGKFDTAASNFVFLTPSLSYGANAVTLTLAQAPPPTPATPTPAPIVTFPSVAVTPNQVASSTALQAGGSGPLFLAVLNSTSVADALAAFDASSGEIHATTLASQFEAATNTRRTVLERMRRPNHDEGWSLWGTV
jgi:outer membrane autotransporter protein